MDRYEVLELGPLEAWDALTTPDGRSGKGFVDKMIGTQYIGLSANAVEPGAESPFWHSHSHLEEIYLFLDGEGQMALDDDVVDVRPGTVVRVGQDVLRIIRCSPDSERPMRYVCIRAGNGELASLPRDATRDGERPRPW